MELTSVINQLDPAVKILPDSYLNFIISLKHLVHLLL